jgi:hypothetical protein
MNIHEMNCPWALELAGNGLQASPDEGHNGRVGDLDLCDGGNLPAPTVRIWTGDEGWKEIPLAIRFLSGEWHPDMERLSPAMSREAAFFAHGAAFPGAGNTPLPGGPAEALARLMAGEWDAADDTPASVVPEILAAMEAGEAWAGATASVVDDGDGILVVAPPPAVALSVVLRQRDYQESWWRWVDALAK